MYHPSTVPKIEDEDMHSEDATLKSILKHEKSAAAILYQLKRHRKQPADIKDVIGVVATLGKVNDANLSRLFNFSSSSFNCS